MDYAESLTPERRTLLQRYRLADAAYKVVGVGAVGTLCGVLLMVSGDGESLYLQFKEATRSVLEAHAGPSPFTHHGERVVRGQRLLQAASDMLLGFATGPTGRHLYIRQLRDAKIKPQLEIMSPRNFRRYAATCGEVLARAHARTADAVVLSAYLGKSAAFDEAIGAFATRLCQADRARPRGPAEGHTKRPFAQPGRGFIGRRLANSPLPLGSKYRPKRPTLSAMIDPFGRHISYLRVSVTDRCDFRCVYCMAEDMTFLPKAEVLSLEELERLCAAFVRRGVKKLRLTGGEPLVRKNVMSLFRGLGRHLDSGALDELTLTTNGSQLAKYAKELAAVGVRRVNVSMDTLDTDKFRELTRWGDLDQVMRGLDAAQQAGLHIKINAVALRGVNDMEFDDLIRWSHGRGMDLTLIEVMPMGEIGDDARLDQYLPLSLARAEIAKHFTLTETDYRTGGPARYFTVEETGGRLGFITPLTHNFCESCNRVRLTCTGTLYMCLGQEDAADLRAPLRASESDELLDQAITEAIARKPKGHDFIIDRRHSGPAVPRHMSVTGG